MSLFLPKKSKPRAMRTATEVVDEACAVPDMVFETDRWSRVLWRSHASHGDLYGTVKRETSKGGGAKAWLGLLREVFHRAYNTDAQRIEDVPASYEWASKVHDAIEAQEGFAELKRRAEDDDWVAAQLASDVDREFRGLMPEDIPDAEAEREALEAMRQLQEARGGDDEDLQRAIENQERALEAAEQALQAASEQVAAGAQDAAARAVQAAEGAVGEMDEAVSGVGFGGHLPGSSAAINERRQILGALNEPWLRDMAKLAGRMRRSARIAQKGKAPAVSEFADIHGGSDISRMLPEELMLLMDPTFEALAHAKMLDEQALQYEVKGAVEESGPILFLVDESGSMGGLGNIYAKAFMLGMMEIARKQGRSFGVCHFANEVSRVDLFPTRESMSPKSIIECAEHFCDGGTSIARALKTAHGFITGRNPWPPGTPHWPDGAKADIVLLTDCEDRVNDKLKKAIRRIRNSETKLIVLGIDTGFAYSGTQGIVEKFKEHADACHMVTNDQLRAMEIEPVKALFEGI